MEPALYMTTLGAAENSLLTLSKTDAKMLGSVLAKSAERER